MQVVRMKAERRSALGRNKVAQLRAEGWLPAVVYGEGKEPAPIQISEWELEQHVKAHHKVFELDIGGAREAAFLQEVVWKATTDRPLHADFRRIDLNKPIESEIEVTLLGHPAGLSKGGVLIKDHIVIRVNSLPTSIPEIVECDISALEIDQALRAKDVPLPAGVTLASEPEMPVCHVAKAVVVAEAPPVAAPEAAEGAAGAPPAGEKPPEKK